LFARIHHDTALLKASERFMYASPLDQLRTILFDFHHVGLMADLVPMN
jgi:hypothetical protein